MYAAAMVGLLNFLLIVLFTPESLPKAEREGKTLDIASANPLGALRLLFGRTPLMRGSASAFFLVFLANACINSQFGNYVNHLFEWGPQESAPLLVLVGLMIAIAPPLLVPRLGLRRSINVGAIVYACGLFCTAFASTPRTLVPSVILSSVGCICIPALIAFIANQAQPAERGALLGGVETVSELCLALAHSGYGRLFAYFISEKAPMKLPGAPFLVATALLLSALGVMGKTFSRFADEAERFL
jgi:DHA1 family tetracycline resistance protein-like MFS transporter